MPGVVTAPNGDVGWAFGVAGCGNAIGGCTCGGPESGDGCGIPGRTAGMLGRCCGGATCGCGNVLKIGPRTGCPGCGSPWSSSIGGNPDGGANGAGATDAAREGGGAAVGITTIASNCDASGVSAAR